MQVKVDRMAIIVDFVRSHVVGDHEERALKRPGFLDSRHDRFVGLALVGLAALGLLVWATLDVGSRVKQTAQSRSDRLRDLGRMTETLFLAEASRIDGLMERLRIELRAQGLWDRPEILDALNLEGDAHRVVEGRRLLALLRRGQQAFQDVGRLELVVAGQSGLSMLRLDRAGDLARAGVSDPREREGIAKALWYADEVRRAVESAGRRLERGDLSFEPIEDTGIPVVPIAIGLNDPGELIQGAVVATVRLDGLARRLAELAGPGMQSEVVTPDGRRLGSPSVDAAGEPRLASLAARVLAAEERPKVFVADGKLVHGVPLAYADGRPVHLLALLETVAPPVGFAAWWSTPWPGVLVLAALISGVACRALLRTASVDDSGRRRAATRESEDGLGGEISESAASNELRRERFALRAWLSDIRSCLERDAATRGLALDLRCERSLPDTLDSDPAWLGGLLVAMGREALDATAEERICVEVVEDAGRAVRFEVAADGIAFEPIGSMEAVARRIGGRFETAQEGRMALILEDAFADRG